MDRVTVQFYKHGGALHWGMETSFLGEDEWGVWLSYPLGAARWKGVEARSPNPHDGVVCVPHDDWWLMLYSPAHPQISHFIDINTPGQWDDGRVELVDLDLDVVVNADGSVEIDDEDEFIVHQVELEYSTDLIEGARTAADRVFRDVSARHEPYFETAAAWLGKV